MLEQFGINPASCNVEKLKSEYQTLSAQKSEVISTYRSSEKEVKDLNRKLENLNKYLHQEVGNVHAPVSEKSIDKSTKPSL